MISEFLYERVGKFIYGACRHGGEVADVCNWMADELGMSRPREGSQADLANLQDRYFAKYVTDEQFAESFQRFMKMMELRQRS